MLNLVWANTGIEWKFKYRQRERQRFSRREEWIRKRTASNHPVWTIENWKSRRNILSWARSKPLTSFFAHRRKNFIPQRAEEDATFNTIQSFKLFSSFSLQEYRPREKLSNACQLERKNDEEEEEEEDQDGGRLVEKMQAYQPVVSSMLLVTGLENRFHWSFLPHFCLEFAKDIFRKRDNVGRKALKPISSHLAI